MIDVNLIDVPSATGSFGKPTKKGTRWQDNMYYQLGFRVRDGDILVAEVPELGVSHQWSGVNSMALMHRWLYRKSSKSSWSVRSTAAARIYVKREGIVMRKTNPPLTRTVNERESVKVLQECIELQKKKGEDYQSSQSNVVQAMHYRRGVDTIYDIMHGKMMRAASLLESGQTPNHESLEDTFKDLINYASFAVSYMRGTMDGQDPNNDMFNRPKK